MQTACCSASDVAGLAAAITERGRSLRLVARGGSMFPAIHHGDRVTVAPIAPERLRRGDIVMTAGSQPRIHRVVLVDHDAAAVVTRGDALAEDDTPASFSEVVGRVVRTERSLAGWSRWLLRRARAVL